MTFAMPLALLLLVPLVAAGVLAHATVTGWAGRLPGAWDRVVTQTLKPFIAERSRIGSHGAPLLCLVIGALLISALSRPGGDADNAEAFATLSGRVIVIDVGADLALHRHVIDTFFETDPDVPTAIVLTSGDAYRIVPFTTDKAQIDRYIRVVDASMMPEPGRRPHLGIVQAEQTLARAGILVRQIVLLSALPAPTDVVEIPPTKSDRIVIALGNAPGWEKWAKDQNADLRSDADVGEIASRLTAAARDVAIAELPEVRVEFTTILIGFAALLWLGLFRRRHE